MLEGVRTHWSGRLALRVEGATIRERGQTITAHFDLSGNVERGELRLYSPLGNTLAHIAWSAHGASLDDGKQIYEYPSLDTLLAAANETPLPAAALFQWLQGVDMSVDGWDADLSQLSRGRISAQRLQPLPRAHLSLVLADD
jgi:outer membrane lipoprotein LolB